MRSHYCGQVTEALAGQTVHVCGWVHRRRDHGGVIFIDLRDREGLLQLVFDPEAKEIFGQAEKLRSEFVVRASGKVRPRPAGTENPNLPTGKVEVLVSGLEVLNRAETPPFQLDDDTVGEDNRLKFRYVDLRRPGMQKNLRLRYQTPRELLDDLERVRNEQMPQVDESRLSAGEADSPTSVWAWSLGITGAAALLAAAVWLGMQLRGDPTEHRPSRRLDLAHDRVRVQHGRAPAAEQVGHRGLARRDVAGEGDAQHLTGAASGLHPSAAPCGSAGSAPRSSPGPRP